MRLNIEHLVNMIISGKQNKSFRPNLDIDLSCLSVHVLVSYQKSTLFVKANYGWISDFKVSIGQPFSLSFRISRTKNKCDRFPADFENHFCQFGMQFHYLWRKLSL